MKKVLPLILVLALCLSLAACGGKAETLTQPETEITEKTENSVTPIEEPSNTKVCAEDEIALELVGYGATPGAYLVNIDFKFRNISDKDFDQITFSAQGLDAYGDVVEDDYLIEENIDAGQAVWFTYQTNSSRSCQTIDELAEKIHSIKLSSVQFTPDHEDPSTLYELDFEKPIVVVVADLQDKETVSAAPPATAEPTEPGENIADALVSHTWNRTDETGLTLATMVFAADGTGKMEMDDGTAYEFKWNVGVNNTVETILLVEDRHAPGTYAFVAENGTYSIQLTDNAEFTYYAE